MTIDLVFSANWFVFIFEQWGIIFRDLLRNPKQYLLCQMTKWCSHIFTNDRCCCCCSSRRTTSILL